jgi:catalase
VIVSAQGAKTLAKLPAARDFLSDAFAHGKFIAHVAAAALFEAVGLENMDSGFVRLEPPEDATGFVETCRKLRFWERSCLSTPQR